MFVMVVGLNYRTAPVEIREQFTFSEEKIIQALTELKQTKSVLEAVIVSTCNRTEIYAVVDQLHTGEHFLTKFLANWFSIAKEEFVPFLYTKKDIEATEHLFKVITGLDSMILGETQILGQVRQAFFTAQQSGATGIIFNTLFKQGITFAKKVHTETGIGENAVSVSYAAVELTKKIFDRLEDKKALIIGAGEMGELTAVHLHSHGIKQIMVANRTYEKGKRLAESFNGKAFKMNELQNALTETDIVISSTGSDSLILHKNDVEKVLKTRQSRPLFFIDIAVPRDIDPAIHQLDGVYLYDIDDLHNIVDTNLKERQKIADKINGWIDNEIYSFYQWINTLGVIPLIAALREKSLKIQQETMKSLENKLPDLTERQKKIISKHTKSIINQMLKNPIMRIKEMSIEPDSEFLIEYFKKIFAIEENEISSNSIYQELSGKEIKKRNQDQLYLARRF